MDNEKTLNIGFQSQWGGEDNWYIKSKKWANKQMFPINHLALGIVEWLWSRWTDTKVRDTMDQVDTQAEEIVGKWTEEEPLPTPEIIVTSSEVKGLDTIEIKSPWDE